MTLIVAIPTDDGVWLAGDRLAGEFHYTEIAGPKVRSMKTADGVPFGVGFAGSPRVAQVVQSVHPPDRQADVRSLEWWLTSYCDAVLHRGRDLGVICDRDSGSAGLADDSTFLLVIEGRVFRIGSELSWEEPARGWECDGGASYTWQGAFEAYRQAMDPVTAAHMACVIAKRHHHIGDLVDAVVLPGRE